MAVGGHGIAGHGTARAACWRQQRRLLLMVRLILRLCLHHRVVLLLLLLLLRLPSLLLRLHRGGGLLRGQHGSRQRRVPRG